MPGPTMGWRAAEHADRVAAVLAGAGVAFLRYPCPTSVREVVAVPSTHRERAMDALVRSGDGLRVRHAEDGAPLPVVRGLGQWGTGPDGHVWLDVPADDPGLDAGLGVAVACELQLWQHTDGVLEAPRQTPWGRWFDDAVLAPGAWPPPTPADEVTFPVDAVYTWVDDTDPAWKARRDEARAAAGRRPFTDDSASDFLFRNRDELRFSLRSLARYAPFVRHVFVVTMGQTPSWLDTSNPRLTVVDHRDVFADPAHLPTFNSHAIEANLHRIEGLAEHYLYINDDFFFARPVRPDLFFHANGIAKAFLSKAQIPPGPPDVSDRGVDVAAKNGRALLRRTFGVRVTQKLKHTPQAQRRSVVRELEQRFPAEFEATSRHPFRHTSDLSVASSLVHHYGLLTGATTHGSIRYDYIWLADVESVAQRLGEILADRDLDVLCLNDAGVDPGAAVLLDDVVIDFLERYFPVPSEFET